MEGKGEDKVHLIRYLRASPLAIARRAVKRREKLAHWTYNELVHRTMPAGNGPYIGPIRIYDDASYEVHLVRNRDRELAVCVRAVYPYK